MTAGVSGHTVVRMPLMLTFCERVLQACNEAGSAIAGLHPSWARLARRSNQAVELAWHGGVGLVHVTHTYC